MSVFRADPYPAYNFLVEMPAVSTDGGEVIAGFSDVSGLEIEQEMISYRNGNDHVLTSRQVPGLVRFPPLVLSRGVTGSDALWQWMQRCNRGDFERNDVLISLLDESRNLVMQWEIRNAMPSRLSGPTLNANAGEIAIETLELSHTGLELRD